MNMFKKKAEKEPEKCINISESYAEIYGIFCIKKRRWIETKNPRLTHGTDTIKAGYTGLCDGCPDKLLPSDLSFEDRVERIRLVDFLVQNYREEICRLYYDGTTTEEASRLWFAAHSDKLPHSSF